MREILKGIIDMHVHAGPSVAVRDFDAIEMLQEAVQAGYRGFLIKDHYFPTMMSATLVEKHFGDNNIKVFGGLALNNSVGAFNLKAIDIAYEMGAKVIFMPTVSAKNHIEFHKESAFGGSGKATLAETPITLIDGDGRLYPEITEALKFIAAKPELILATGHGNPREIDAVINQAVSLGIKKIWVNHPYYIIGAGIEDMRKWAKMGAYIELNATLLAPGSDWYVLPIDKVMEILGNVPIEQLILVSDQGVKGNGSAVERLYELIMHLMNEGKVTERQINMMAKETPAKLLGI